LRFAIAGVAKFHPAPRHITHPFTQFIPQRLRAIQFRLEKDLFIWHFKWNGEMPRFGPAPASALTVFFRAA
jgi:hypothetical protein